MAIVEHHHISILDPAPTGEGGALVQNDLVALADYDLSLAAMSALIANSVTAHIADTANPHFTTAAQVGAYTTAQTDTLLAGKANDVHQHSIADITSLQTALDGKAAVSHVHAIADVTGLQTALDAKALASDLSTHTAATAAHGATAANTASAIVARDSSGDFAMHTLTLTGDITGSGFWTLRAGAAGDGRIDIRASQFLVFGTLSPQNDLEMGWSGGTQSRNILWTGKIDGNYRKIYTRYDNGNLIYYGQWTDGSWDHEMGRWNDHGDFTAVGNVSAGGQVIAASNMIATGYVVGDYQVVGARQPSIDDAAGGGDEAAKINLILAALRTHGLIQTPA